MTKKTEGLEEIAELLSIGIARERESFEFYAKAYGKCLSSCESKPVQKALSILLEQKKKNEAELRKQLNAINLELMQIQGRRIKKSIVIDASPEQVFSLLTDRAEVPKWNELIREARGTSKEPTGVGSTVHYVGQAGGSRGEWDIETTEWVKDRKYAWRTTSGDIAMIATWTLKEIDGATELTYEFRYKLPYSILGKVIDKLRVNKDVKDGMARALQNLKQLLEKKPAFKTKKA
jgi:uncharacterized protein YndB with AHSA1/START domain